MYGVKIYKDDFLNKATIEKVRILPYFGASVKKNIYKLSCVSMYNNSFCYHVSVHETEKDAISKMMGFSCGTWKEVIE